MFVEYNRFWNKNRLQKAKNLNLTKTEVITLASIVQKETAKNKIRLWVNATRGDQKRDFKSRANHHFPKQKRLFTLS